MAFHRFPHFVGQDCSTDPAKEKWGSGAEYGTVGSYYISISGRVQDVGFRDFVEDLGRSKDLRGFVFNSPDGTVKIVTTGSDREVNEFIDDIRDTTARLGADIRDIDSKRLDGDPYLPPTFIKAPTDELSDIGRKLDDGVHYINEIRQDTSEIKSDTGALVDGQQEMIDLLDRRL